MKKLRTCVNCDGPIKPEEEHNCEECGAYLCGQCICEACENEKTEDED